MKYGILDYDLLYNHFNIGDYAQSLAAAQYIPRIDNYLNRENLNNYRGEKIKLILNGWFMNKPSNWPPSEDIHPLFISFHINRFYEKQMLSQRAVSYMKNINSIGCRDYHTAEVLESYGINSYYSSCLTTTLKSPNQQNDNRKGVYLVDILHGVPNKTDYINMPIKYVIAHLKNFNIGKSILKAHYLKEIDKRLPTSEVKILQNRIIGTSLDTLGKFKLAQEYLNKLATAKLVITSRIHCALPCLAFNTPVIFIKYGQSSKSNLYRFKGILDHFNVIDLDKDLEKNGFLSNIIDFDDIDYDNPLENPISFRLYCDRLAKTCDNFVADEI